MGEKAKAVSPSETIDSLFLEGDEKTQGIKWPRAGASDELTNESLDLGVVHSQSKQVVEILEGLVVFGVERRAGSSQTRDALVFVAGIEGAVGLSIGLPFCEGNGNSKRDAHVVCTDLLIESDG